MAAGNDDQPVLSEHMGWYKIVLESNSCIVNDCVESTAVALCVSELE